MGVKRAFEFTALEDLRIARCIICVSIPVACMYERTVIDRSTAEEQNRGQAFVHVCEADGEWSCVRKRDKQTEKHDRQNTQEWIRVATRHRMGEKGRGSEQNIKRKPGIQYGNTLTCAIGAGARMPGSAKRGWKR